MLDRTGRVRIEVPVLATYGSMHRLFALALLAFLVACVQKSDVPAPVPGCQDLDGCTSSSASDDGPVSDDEISTTTSTSTSTTTRSSTDSSGDDGSSITATDGSEESSSTGDLADGPYAPCSDDEACASGVCTRGFCTEYCWSPIEGETPCPPVPGDAEGVTVVCGTIGFPGGPDHFVCEGCFDCAQYCIPVCDVGSVCPSGGVCGWNFCSPEGGGHCGSGSEIDDASCSDGLDNDLDGHTDCEDYDCSSGTFPVTVCGPPPEQPSD